MWRNARRGGARLSAHQNRSLQLYLQSPKMYFVALRHRGRLPAQPPSDMAENAPREQGERGSSARDARRASTWAGHAGSMLSRGAGDVKPEQQAQEAPTAAARTAFFRGGTTAGGRGLGVHLYLYHSSAVAHSL